MRSANGRVPRCTDGTRSSAEHSSSGAVRDADGERGSRVVLLFHTHGLSRAARAASSDPRQAACGVSVCLVYVSLVDSSTTRSHTRTRRVSYPFRVRGSARLTTHVKVTSTDNGSSVRSSHIHDRRADSCFRARQTTLTFAGRTRTDLPTCGFKRSESTGQRRSENGPVSLPFSRLSQLRAVRERELKVPVAVPRAPRMCTRVSRDV